MKTTSTFATVAAGFLCLLVEQVLSAKTEYKVITKTGDESDAGTEAKVYIRIYDESYAHTNEERLKKGTFGFKPFKKGGKDSFTVKAKALGELKKITIRHDNKGNDPSWYLEKVIIKVGGKTYHFPCQCWLDTQKGTGVSRTVFAAVPEEKLDYKVITKTGDEELAGTDANVFITIYGENGRTREIELKKTGLAALKNSFERGNKDSFNVKAKHLGKLIKIVIRHDNTGNLPGWYLNKVKIKVGGKTYYFPCQCWLDTQQGTGISQTVLAAVPEERLVYKVTTKTGDEELAGTDANVFITIYGENGRTREIELKKTGLAALKNSFERGNKDSFDVKAKHLGKLIKIVIRHDNTGNLPGWYLNKVKIKVGGVTYKFPCNCWLDKYQGNEDTTREIYEEGLAQPSATPTQTTPGTSTPTKTTFGTSPTTQTTPGTSTPTKTTFGTSPTTQTTPGTSPSTKTTFGTSPTTQTTPGTSPPTETTHGTSPPTKTTFGTSPTTQTTPGTSPPTKTTFGTSPTTQTASGTTPATTQSTLTSFGTSPTTRKQTTVTTEVTIVPTEGGLSYSAAEYYWPFDVQKGRITPDINGGKDATLGGNAQLVPSMRRPMVAATSGDVITLGDFKGTCFSDPTPCASTGLTVMFWLELKRHDIYKLPLHDRYILSSGAQTKQARGFFLAARPKFGLYIEVVTASLRWQSLIPEDGIPEKWSNLALSWSVNQGIKMFLNGQEAGKVQFSNAVAERPVDKYTVITINKPNHKENKEYQTNFKIDDLAFFSQCLTEDEIKQVLSNSMQAKQVPTVSTATASTFVPPFGEVSASTASKPTASTTSGGTSSGKPTSASSSPGGSTVSTSSGKPTSASSSPGGATVSTSSGKPTSASSSPGGSTVSTSSGKPTSASSSPGGSTVSTSSGKPTSASSSLGGSTVSTSSGKPTSASSSPGGSTVSTSSGKPTSASSSPGGSTVSTSSGKPTSASSSPGGSTVSTSSGKPTSASSSPGGSTVSTSSGKPTSVSSSPGGSTVSTSSGKPTSASSSPGGSTVSTSSGKPTSASSSPGESTVSTSSGKPTSASSSPGGSTVSTSSGKPTSASSSPGGSTVSTSSGKPTSASSSLGGSTVSTSSGKPTSASSSPGGATVSTSSGRTGTQPPVATATSSAKPPPVVAGGVDSIAAAAVRRAVAKALGLLAGMHSASPAFVDELLNKAAQEISEELGVARRADINKNAKYGTNICINDGPIEELAMKCASQWYSKVKDYNWLYPRLTPAVQPFVQLVWRGNKRLGVGISKNSSGKYVLVVIFDSPANQHQLAQNVWPTEDVFEPTLQSKCPENYKQVGQTCFTYHGTPQTWENAVLGCAREGAVLWTLRSSQEENTVKSIIATSSTDTVWLGIHDRPSEGSFMSVSGRPVEYLNWYPYEPNGGVVENCVSMTTTTYAGSWADQKCSEQRPFICRKPLPGIVSYRVELKISGQPRAQPQPYVVQVQLQNPYSGYRRNTVIRDIHAAITTTLEQVYSGQGLFMTPHLETLITDPAGNSTAHVVLKFGPNAGDTSAQPLLDFLKKKGGKFPSLDEDVTVVAYDLIRPGTGACTYNCFASCTFNCQPSCCSSRSSLPAQTAPAAPYFRPTASRVFPAPLQYQYRRPAPYAFKHHPVYFHPARPFPYPARSYFRPRLGSARDTVPAVEHVQIPHPQVSPHAYQSNAARHFLGIQRSAGPNGCIFECRRPRINAFCPSYCPAHCCTNSPVHQLVG